MNGTEPPRRLSLPIGVDAGESQAVGAVATAAAGPLTIVSVIAVLPAQQTADI